MEQRSEEMGVGVDAGLHAGGNAANAATVPAPQVGVEQAVVGRERWEWIHAQRAAGGTVTAIAREADLDRKTVRRCLRQNAWQPYRRPPAADDLLAARRDWFTERAAAVNCSARILFQELRVRHDWAGSYATVREAVRPLRVQAAAAAVTQRRFETGPGEQAQADWGQARVRLGGAIAKVHVFVLTLGYSRRGWAEAYPHERMESLLAAHEHAFAHFGGVTREILYDRMRTVLEGEADGVKRWNARFKAFAEYWGFEPRVCRPYRAQTKGKVESGVKYVKRNFLPGRTFRDLADLNEQLRQWQEQIADHRVHGTTHEVPLARFAREAQALLLTVGRASFLQALRRERAVAGDWLVSIDGNRYSVPWQLIGATVEVVRVGGAWQISHRSQVVAEHEVLAGQHRLSVRPEHGPGAAARNARLRYAGPASARPAAPVAPPSVEVRDPII
ncbi:MAG: IS21 family transposase [Betaproteobacteria bacterium]